MYLCIQFTYHIFGTCLLYYLKSMSVKLHPFIDGTFRIFNIWPHGVAVRKVLPFHLPWFPAAQHLYTGCGLFFTVWMVCQSVWVSVCLYVGSEWLCESSVFVCLPIFIYKNLHSDLIWSDRIWALLWSEMIGNSLASLHGVEQPASQQTPGPPRFKLWSEVMNGSDILVFCGFGVISNVTVDNEYRGDSDLTTTTKLRFLTWLWEALHNLGFSCPRTRFLSVLWGYPLKKILREELKTENTFRGIRGDFRYLGNFKVVHIRKCSLLSLLSKIKVVIWYKAHIYGSYYSRSL